MQPEPELTLQTAVSPDNSITPVDQFKSTIKTMPDEVKELIDLLSDPNNRMSDIDDKFGWATGTTLSKLRRYPLLKRTVEEARILGLRRVGIEKEDAYKVYKDGMGAVGYSDSGKEYIAHEVRIKAADRVLGLMGENPLKGLATKVEVGVQVNISESEKVELERLRGSVRQG